MLKIENVVRLDLGVKAENMSRAIEIDCNLWKEQYPNGNINIYHQRPGETTMDVTGATYNNETGVLRWELTQTDTFIDGFGLAEIRLVEDNIVKKTATIVTLIHPSVVDTSGGVIESNQQAYLDAASAIFGSTQQEAIDAHAYAQDSEAWAKGTRDGSAVNPTDETYENNAKYYAEQAAGSATTAGAAATTAVNYGTTAAQSASQATASATAAEGSKTAAANYSISAAGSANQAYQAKLDAQSAASNASSMASSATSQASRAISAAERASTSENHASSSAEEAAASAAAAGSCLTAAEASAAEAAVSAGVAGTAAEAASASETAAAASEAAAGASERSAKGSETSAFSSANSAYTSKTDAAASATAAAASATAAAGSASEAAATAAGIAAAGAAQIAAIEAKGEEVIEEIPADYTELSEDVDDLKSAITFIGSSIVRENDHRLNKQADWENGYFGFGSGNSFDSTYRIRTNADLPLYVNEIYCIDGVIDFFAWEKDTYIGHWNGTAFTTENTAANLTYIDVEKIREVYPTYRYRIVWRKSESSTASIGTSSYAYILMLSPESRHHLSPFDFGAVGDGVTDDRAHIVDCIRTAISLNRNVVFDKAVYLISSGITISNSVNIDGKYSEVVYNGSGGGETFVFLIDADTTAGKRCTFKNITINMAESARYGLRIDKNTNAFVFKNFQINNVSSSGVAVYMNGGGGKFFDFVCRCNIHDNYAHGFLVHAVDSVLKDIIVVNFHTGISTTNNIQIINYHPWNSFAELMKTSIGIYTESLVILTNSFIDTFAKCFSGTGYLCISGLMCFWSTNYYTDESVGDSTTLPVIFSGNSLHIVECNGMRVYPARGRTDTHIKFTDSNLAIEFNPRIGNLLESVTDIPKVFYNEGALTLREGVTESYTQIRKYNETIVLFTELTVSNIPVYPSKSVATLPSNCKPKTTKNWVCPAYKSGDTSDRAPVEVTVDDTNGAINVRALSAPLTGSYVVQISQEYMSISN